MEGEECNTLTMGDFTKLVMLGYGGFGKVFLVERNSGTNKGKKYAMKTVWKPIYLSEIMAEREILQQIKGLPHLMQMHHAFADTTELHFILDFARGGDLLRVVDNKKILTKLEIREYIGGAVKGIGGLHKLNIIHRDIKLENILIDNRGFTMITDFGISKLGNNQPSTRCGTSTYHAPEIKSALTYDKTIDWWALGIVIWELVSLKRHGGGLIDKSFYDTITSDKILDMVKLFQVEDPKKRLGYGQRGTYDIEQNKFFPTGFWEAYEKSYKNTPHPKEEDVLEMVKNFNTHFTTLNFRVEDNFSKFNYNNKKTAKAPVTHIQQENPNSRNDSEYINICALQVPVTRAQHKKKDQHERAKEIIYVSDSSITKSYISGSTQKMTSALKRMYEGTEPEDISQYKNRR